MANRRSFDFGGHRFDVDRGVFHPVRYLSGVAFASQLEDVVSEFLPEAQTAVEVGTGCGLLGATLAQLGLQVVATDVDSRAVDCATKNCAGLTVQVRHGDMFEPVARERFDVALVNPPYERERPSWRRSRAFTSTNFLERFGASVHSIAPIALIGFPVEDEELLKATDLDLTHWRTVPTAGRALGLYISSVPREPGTRGR